MPHTLRTTALEYVWYTWYTCVDEGVCKVKHTFYHSIYCVSLMGVFVRVSLCSSGADRPVPVFPSCPFGAFFIKYNNRMFCLGPAVPLPYSEWIQFTPSLLFSFCSLSVCVCLGMALHLTHPLIKQYIYLGSTLQSSPDRSVCQRGTSARLVSWFRQFSSCVSLNSE